MHKTAAVPNFLSAAEVCDQLAIDRSTLTRWVQSGRIRAAQKLPGPRGAYLFDPAEVERVKALLAEPSAAELANTPAAIAEREHAEPIRP